MSDMELVDIVAGIEARLTDVERRLAALEKATAGKTTVSKPARPETPPTPAVEQPPQ